MKSPNDHYIELGRKQVFGTYGFHWNNQNFINCLVKYHYVRWTLTCAYSGLVSSKKMVPIESLPEEDKENLRSMAKYYADGRLKKKELMELIKALITLEYFLQ